MNPKQEKIMITKKEVENLAKLSKLKFTQEELENFTKDMAEIIDFADTINQNIGGDFASADENVAEWDSLREDEVQPSLPNEEILSNADGEDGYFVVRRNCLK
jgi:aspartyl-tRNA(Asn)/glutamyl-tRNA(Gln) amidotransferase subunit C